MSTRASRITSLILLLITPSVLMAADNNAAMELVDAPSAVAMRAPNADTITAELKPQPIQPTAVQPPARAMNAARHTISVPAAKPAKVRAAMPQADGADGSRWGIGVALAAVAGAIAFGVMQATDDDAEDPVIDDD